MNEDFEEMARIGSAGANEKFDARIEREGRLQTRARRVRFACRYTIIICGLLGFGLVYLGISRDSRLLFNLGSWLFPPTLLAAVILFFMGGLAPSRVRFRLSKRQRKMLDN